MEIDTKFKKLMIEYPEIVRRAVLTDKQIKVFNFVQIEDVVRTPDVTAEFGWSSQQASAMLVSLFRAGYLDRHEEIDPTGGYRFRYNAKF